MKKLFKMSAVILFVLIVFSACGRNESVSGKITSFPPYGERVVTAIGDSIAAGYGLDTQEDNYLTLFSDNIGAVLNNDAVSGYDSGEVLKSLADEKTAADRKNAECAGFMHIRQIPDDDSGGSLTWRDALQAVSAVRSAPRGDDRTWHSVP